MFFSIHHKGVLCTAQYAHKSNRMHIVLFVQEKPKRIIESKMNNNDIAVHSALKREKVRNKETKKCEL